MFLYCFSVEYICFALEIYLGIDVNQGEHTLINEADSQPPHKIDENMWRNREYIEETIFLLEASNWPEAVMYIL